MNNSVFYPIYDILPDSEGHGLIIGNNGSLSYVIRLLEPEVFSLYKDEIERRHGVFMQALSHMPDNSFVHKQDVFCKSSYKASGLEYSYLASADASHFADREYLKHACVLCFTLSGLKSLSEAYTKNGLSYKESLINEDVERLSDFLSAVQFAINNISSLRGIDVLFMGVDELKKYVFSSANFYEERGIADIHFSEEISAGKFHARMFAITDEEFFSATEYDVAEKDYSVSLDKSELYMSISEDFGGIHFNFNHVYNQVLYFYSDKILKDKLRKNLDDHISNKGWDKVGIPPKITALTSLVDDINDRKDILCYAYYSIMLWDDDKVALAQAEKKLKEKMDVHNINYYIPGYGNLADIYGAGIVGCTASIDIKYMFLTSLALASCFLCHYSTFRDDPEGIYFNDRLTQIPLKKDIWDSKNRRIKARNSVVIAPTGSGKSFLTNNIIYQLLDQGFTVVGVEFGNSFKQLCYLYPDISIHIEYDPSMPLGINPFDLEGLPMTQEKEDALITLCLRFWRKPDADANLTVALRKLLALYYKKVGIGHSFQGFYSFLTEKDNYQRLCEEIDLKETYFDIDSFSHVCSEFMPGGAFANLCAADGVAGGLSNKRFIHFELTKVKANPFVASVVMSLLFDVINNKILSNPAKRGYIVFDEYAETAQMKSTSSLDVNIHQTVAFFYQKIRKENGAVMTIIQSPVQLPDNEYTKGIIANTQLLYVLEATEVVYDAIINTFKIKNQSHINQMKSIQNNYSCTHPYSECWIRFGENYALTVRLEASRRKYLAFQTQGEIRSRLDELYQENGRDMKAAIEQYITQTV